MAKYVFKKLVDRLLSFCVTFFVSFAAFAQQTIFNVPSADITEKKRTYLQHEGQFRAREPNRFYAATNYATYGIGDNVELNATQFNFNSPPSQNDSLGLGFKSVYDLNFEQYQSWKPKLIFGAMAPISMVGNGVGSWVYGQGSIMIPQTSTRITGGINHGTKQIFGRDVVCALGGVEQKVSSKFSLIADWYSGNHVLGMLSVGFSYQFPREVILFAGYQKPNSKEVGRNSMVFELGKTF